MGNYSWQINPQTGDYVLNGGAPVIDKTLGTPAYIRLQAPRNGWLYAPDSTYGSDYYQSHVRVQSSTQIDNIAKNALQPFITQGRAQSVNVQTVATAISEIAQQVTIVENIGSPETIVLVPIGDL